MKKILFVCHGNICRSPMAEFLMKDFLEKKGVSRDYLVESMATSTEELGNPVHYGTARILDKLNINYFSKRAVQVKKSDYEKYDYILVMDNLNLRNIMRIFGEDPQNKVKLLLSYSPNPRSVADPYYTGDFNATYRDIVEGIECFYEQIK